jgi:hypothetical protein
MRTIRAVITAAAVIVALPSISSAQGGRQFRDAWFWGVKAGGLTYSDSVGSYKQAPMAGVEWMITRKHGGLYISAGQAFLTSQVVTLYDPNAPVDSGFRAIDLKNLRRLDVALMGFPGEHLRFHPYVGIGFALNAVSDATPRGPFTNSDQLAYANQLIQEQKVAFAPMFIAGAQYRFSWASVFAQGTVSQSQRDFLLYTGRPFNFVYELGIRYNVGSSIDRQ